jgi:hypothetical protein
MYKVRSRFISFRVTEEEFQQVVAASAQDGSRSFSDFARSVVLSAVQDSDSVRGRPAPPDQKLVCFDRRLAEIETNLARLMEAIARSGRGN